MFNNLINFSYKRNWKEAIGFYIFYLILGLVFSGLINLILGFTMQIGIQHLSIDQARSQVDAFTHDSARYEFIVFVLMILILLLKTKKLLNNFKSILVILLSILLTYIGGIILGMLIPTLLTTSDDVNL